MDPALTSPEAGHWVYWFWASWEGLSGVDQRQMLPMTGPGQNVWSYKAIHNLWLPLLDMSVCRKDQDVCQG